MHWADKEVGSETGSGTIAVSGAQATASSLGSFQGLLQLHREGPRIREVSFLLQNGSEG